MTKEFTPPALKVHGKKSEDLEIISSHIQDARFKFIFSYNSEDQTFVLWEIGFVGSIFCIQRTQSRCVSIVVFILTT